ncbi:hypothetical protein CJF31_00006094 [Rutstroemia sp. NJR-2017a BVV2]|nr:hypothetical protein CJF31_00010220 [Rutstroemia sp. NJR-2017a BVV2]PQE25227.1 hypothetical protein CJF31_00006094 [Rutstroemia sp. NJR-2017a BVV2]
MVLLVFTFILISLIEYTCHMMPQHKGFGELPNEFLNNSPRSSLGSGDISAIKAEYHLFSQISTPVLTLNTMLARNLSGAESKTINYTSIGDTRTAPSVTIILTTSGPHMSVGGPIVHASSSHGTYMPVGNSDSQSTPSPNLVLVTSTGVTQITITKSKTPTSITSDDDEPQRASDSTTKTITFTSIITSGPYLKPGQSGPEPSTTTEFSPQSGVVVIITCFVVIIDTPLTNIIKSTATPNSDDDGLRSHLSTLEIPLSSKPELVTTIISTGVTHSDITLTSIFESWTTPDLEGGDQTYSSGTDSLGTLAPGIIITATSIRTITSDFPFTSMSESTFLSGSREDSRSTHQSEVTLAPALSQLIFSFTSTYESIVTLGTGQGSLGTIMATTTGVVKSEVTVTSIFESTVLLDFDDDNDIRTSGSFDTVAGGQSNSAGGYVYTTLVTRTSRVSIAASSLGLGILTSDTPRDTDFTVIESTFTSVYTSTYLPSIVSPAHTVNDKPVATSVNSSGIFYIHSDGSITIPPQITYSQYLIVSFLPLFIAIFYSIPWRIVENTIRCMEPIYQLQQSLANGNSSDLDPINLDYESSWTIVLPFKAYSRKHFTVLWTSLVSVLILIVAPLGSQVMIISEMDHYLCTESGRTLCDFWGIYPDLARMIEVLLGFIAAFTIFLIVSGWNRKTGVYSEPLSIIGLAVITGLRLYRQSRVLSGFQGIDGETRNLSLQRLPTYQRSGEGSLASNNAAQNTSVRRFLISTKATSKLICTLLQDRLLYLSALALLTGTLGVVAAYYETAADTGFNRFMNSQGFGVRFFMTAVGTVVNLLWSRIDTGKSFISFDNLTLTTEKSPILHSPCSSRLSAAFSSPAYIYVTLYAVFPSLRRRQYLVALVSFCSILSEFLPITLANVPYSRTATYLVFLICNYIAIAILSIMIIILLLLLVTPLFFGQGTKLPKIPITIAEKLMYLVPSTTESSNFLRNIDADELGLLGRKERDAKVIDWGKTYSIDVGEDQKLRIDEDEGIVAGWTGGS